LLHFKADFSPQPTSIDIFLDGDSLSGYSFRTDRPIFDFDLPSELILTIYGSASGSTILTNPTNQGDYIWSADFTSDSTPPVIVTRSQTLNIPGTTTPTGTDVIASFNNGSSVTFSEVTASGSTIIATSTTPPPEGTGQFQPSEGLYYDFTTTATIVCPCTVTLPYDPVTTPNPRIYHLNTTVSPAVWEDATTSVDTINHTVTGVVSSFSFFAVGQPNFSINWRLPLELPKGKEAVFPARIQILPITFSLLNSNGRYVERNDVTIQILNSNGQVVAEFPPRLILRDGKFYIAMLKVRQLNLRAGEYTVKAKVGNTTVSPSIDFILR
jgi:hypothetical protein